MEAVTSSWIVFALTVLIAKVLCNSTISDYNVKEIYDELRVLGTSCYPLYSCGRNKTNDGLNPCDCDNSCSLYDTCCVDSEFRTHKDSPKHKSNMKCLSVNNDHEFQVFMMDSCKSNETSDDLCFSDPEASNDPFLMIPDTSNLTGITYKNYFCAVCNEEVDSTELEFWDMQVSAHGTLLKNLTMPQFKFNQTMGIWTVFDSESNKTSAALPVTLNIQPSSQATVKQCSTDLVESCSSRWTNEAIAIKCRGYMALVQSAYNLVKYRNPHCARCNFENLRHLRCFSFKSGLVGNIYPESNRRNVDRHDSRSDRRTPSDFDRRYDDRYHGNSNRRFDDRYDSRSDTDLLFRPGNHFNRPTSHPRVRYHKDGLPGRFNFSRTTTRPPLRPFSKHDIPLISLFVLEDRRKRCGRKMVYDKFADKCRCNSRIHVKENGKCVHKI